MVKDEKSLLGVIGMCRGAGKAIIGVNMICEHLRKKHKGQNNHADKSANGENNDSNVDFIVIEASDTSENTHKKITDKCAYYNVRHIRIHATCSALGHSVGKGEVGAVAIADASFCRAVEAKLS